MAKYTIETIKEKPEFLDFVKKEYGYDSFEEIPLWEQNALFYKFKALENDLEDKDFTLLSTADDNTNLEDITAVYYPGRKYDDLEMEDLAFVQAMSVSLSQPGAPTVEKVRAQRINDGDYDLGMPRQHYSKENLENILHAHEIYLKTPEEAKETDPDLAQGQKDEIEAEQNNLFAETVEQGTIDIADFAKGDLSIDDDAVETMQQYIETFGKEYQNGVYKYTPEAEAALSRLNTLRTEIKQRTPENTDKNQDEYSVGIIPTPQEENLDNKVSERPTENKTGGIIIDEGEQDNVNKRSNENIETAKSEDLRKRSENSDNNEFMIEKLQLEVLRDMGIITDKIYNSGIKDPQSAIDTFHSMRELNKKEQKELESRMTDKMLSDEKLFSMVPPSFLADRYESLQQKLADETKSNSADASATEANLNQVEKRIDRLVEDVYNNQGIYFNDVTNIADTYDGYMKMFEAREKYLNENNTDDIDLYKSVLEANRGKMRDYIAQYDETWNLSSLNEQDAGKLDKRFDEIIKGNEKAVLNDETLALVSNFKFLDKDSKPEAQFQRPQGEKSDVWQKGYTIIPDSKLSTVVEVSKQKVLMENLGSEAEITPEFLSQELNNVVPETLFAMHVADKTVHGVLEHPEEFTDKKHLDAFVKDLGNVEKPMSISPLGYEAAVDGQINEVGGFAGRLASKIGNDKPVVMKVFEPLKKFDKRAGDRVADGKPNKKKIRIEMLKRTLKSGLSAFLVSGAITTAGAAMAADTQLTAATGGMNKVAGAALGITLASVMITRNYVKWRKERKKDGKSGSLFSFVKQPRMMSTVATTALGAAAVGFAISGNPGVAQICGYSALAIGAGSGIVLDTIDTKKAGLSTLESFGWAALRSLTTVGAALGGRAAANEGIDWYNRNNPDNNLFQHKESDGQEWKVTGKETVTDFGALDDNAEKFLQNNWYKDHPDLLQQRIDALTAAGVEHPHHMLLASHDSGLIAPDNMQMWDGTTSHGNHTVLTQTWAEQSGVNYDDVQALKHVFNADGSVNTDAINAYKNVAGHIGEDNFVTRMDPRPVIRELYGDRESTYDRNGILPTKEIETGEWVDKTKMVRNESDLGLGMLGIFTKPVKAAKKLKDRIGSLADRIFNKQKPKKPEPPLPPVAPIPPKRPEKPEQPLPPVTPIPPKKPEKPEQPKPEDKLLLDEYKIVYGIEPETKEGKNKAWKDYCKRVEEERKATAPDKDMNEFLSDRRQALDEAIMSGVPSENNRNVSGKPIRSDYLAKQAKDDRGHAGVVMEGRQSLMQSNLTKDNFANKITLSHFTKYMKHFVDKDNNIADCSRDISLNPEMKRKYDKPGSKVKIVDLNLYLVEGKDLEQSITNAAGKDARKAMAKVKKDNER